MENKCENCKWFTYLKMYEVDNGNSSIDEPHCIIKNAFYKEESIDQPNNCTKFEKE